MTEMQSAIRAWREAEGRNAHDCLLRCPGSKVNARCMYWNAKRMLQRRLPACLTSSHVSQGCVGARLPPLRRAPAGLEGLLRIVTDQMISLQARRRSGEGSSELAPLTRRRSAQRQTTLMKLGLSGAKSRAFRPPPPPRPWQAGVRRALPPARTEALAALVALPGIGPWTADIYVLSAWAGAMPGRRGIWRCRLRPPSLRPRKRANSEEWIMAETWRPWRTVAARLLWAITVASRACRSVWRSPPSQNRHTRCSRSCYRRVREYQSPEACPALCSTRTTGR